MILRFLFFMTFFCSPGFFSPFFVKISIIGGTEVKYWGGGGCIPHPPGICSPVYTCSALLNCIVLVYSFSETLYTQCNYKYNRYVITLSIRIGCLELCFANWSCTVCVGISKSSLSDDYKIDELSNNTVV